MADSQDSKINSINPSARINKQARGTNDAGYWIGSDGVIHKIGTGLFDAFLGKQGGDALGGLLGMGEDAALGSLVPNEKESLTSTVPGEPSVIQQREQSSTTIINKDRTR